MEGLHALLFHSRCRPTPGHSLEGIAQVQPRVADVLRDASLNAFEALVELAIGRNAAFVLFAGDIYDGPQRGIRAQLTFVKGLRRLSDAGIWSFVVHGNHDPVATGWSAIRADWPLLVKIFSPDVVEGVTVERDGEPIAKVYGVSLETSRDGESCAALPPTDPGQNSTWECSTAMLEGYWITTLTPLVRSMTCGDLITTTGRSGISTFVPWSTMGFLASPTREICRGEVPKQANREPRALLLSRSTVPPSTHPSFVPLDVVRFPKRSKWISHTLRTSLLEDQVVNNATRLRAELNGWVPHSPTRVDGSWATAQGPVS